MSTPPCPHAKAPNDHDLVNRNNHHSYESTRNVVTMVVSTRTTTGTEDRLGNAEDLTVEALFEANIWMSLKYVY